MDSHEDLARDAVMRYRYLHGYDLPHYPVPMVRGEIVICAHTVFYYESDYTRERVTYLTPRSGHTSIWE